MKKVLKDKLYIIVPLILAIILGIIAYFYAPTKGYDLYEYYFWMDKMLLFKFGDLIKYIFYRLEFFSMFYLFIIALIGNYNLVQVFPTILLYFIIFYMFFDYAKENNINTKIIFLFLLLFVSLFKFIFVVSSFRYSLAYTIFSLAIYLEYVKGKDKLLYKLLYIVPIFIHSSAVVLLCFRIIMYFKNKYFRLGILCVLCAATFFPNIVINILNIFSFNSYVNFFVERIKMYLINEHIPMYNQYLFRIMQSLLILLVIIFNFIYKKNVKLEKFNRIYLMFSIFTVAVASYHTLFMRFSDLLLFLSPVMLLDTYQKVREMPRFFQVCSVILIITLIAIGIKIQIPIFQIMYF